MNVSESSKETSQGSPNLTAYKRKRPEDEEVIEEGQSDRESGGSPRKCTKTSSENYMEVDHLQIPESIYNFTSRDKKVENIKKPDPTSEETKKSNDSEENLTSPISKTDVIDKLTA